jgi:hypothetical protein
MKRTHVRRAAAISTAVAAALAGAFPAGVRADNVTLNNGDTQNYTPSQIQTANGVTLDYAGVGPDHEIATQHYAFLVTEDEFDVIWGRIKDQGITYYPVPWMQDENQINHNDGGRGLYFLDPSGRLAETSRGNLFVLGTDDVWRTPPAGEDVLPGVTRRALLDVLGDHGVPVDIVPLTVAGLAAARSAVWTSSLSGVVGVTELDGRRLVDGPEGGVWTGWLGFG